MNGAKLLIDNRVIGARACGLDVPSVVFHQLLDLIGVGVKREQAQHAKIAVAVGNEINLVTDPHGIHVAAVFVRHFGDARILKLGNPDFVLLTALVALPARLPLVQWFVSNVCSIRGELSSLSAWQRNPSWRAVPRLDREKAQEVCIAFTLA